MDAEPRLYFSQRRALRLIYAAMGDAYTTDDNTHAFIRQETAEVLAEHGFVTIDGGEVHLTDAGIEYINSRGVAWP
jgi:hypothetical protein